MLADASFIFIKMFYGWGLYYLLITNDREVFMKVNINGHYFVNQKNMLTLATYYKNKQTNNFY